MFVKVCVLEGVVVPVHVVLAFHVELQVELIHNVTLPLVPPPASPVLTLTPVMSPTQLIPGQALWLRPARQLPSRANVAVPLVAPPYRPAPAVTPVMSPVQVV